MSEPIGVSKHVGLWTLSVLIKHIGLWILSVLIADFFAYYLSLNTAGCRLIAGEGTHTETTTGRLIQRMHGDHIKYSFVANGRTFVAIGRARKKPVEWIVAGNPLVIFYDPHNPSISVLEISEFELECGELLGVSGYAVILCSILGISTRIFVALKERRQLVMTRVPKIAMIAAEIQTLAASASAACLFVISGAAGIYKYPGNFILAAVLSILPALWAVLAAQGLWRGSRVGWVASIVGDLICFGLLIWCGMRGPLAIAASGALLGTPIILLLLPQVTGFYLQGRNAGLLRGSA